jgi:hypothetical protein
VDVKIFTAKQLLEEAFPEIEGHPLVWCEEVRRRGRPHNDWRFKCPWCDRWHYHGEGEGPRASHCDVPEAPGTYFIKLKLDMFGRPVRAKRSRSSPPRKNPTKSKAAR